MRYRLNQINEDSSADLDFYFPYAMGYMGIVFALVLANLGAAYGTAKSGVGICAMGIMKPTSIIKGDLKSITISAASVIAKVTRDRMMEEYDSIYPEYHFASNKGYGSAEHIAALKKYGPCPIHRRSFIGNFV